MPMRSFPHRSLLKLQHGFTLIELLVVAVILAIITAVAIPLLNDSTTESYVPEAVAVLSSISTTAQRCKLMYGAFNNASCTLPNFIAVGYVDVNTTNKWTFTYNNAHGTGCFEAYADGKTGTKLAGKRIKLRHDLGATPHETLSYNF